MFASSNVHINASLHGSQNQQRKSSSNWPKISGIWVAWKRNKNNLPKENQWNVRQHRNEENDLLTKREV